MSDIKAIPLGDRIIIELIEEPEVTEGGIILASTKKEAPTKGKVIAVGQGRTLENGEREKIEVEVGDVIMFPAHSGSEIKLGQMKCKVLSAKEIFCKVIEENKGE